MKIDNEINVRIVKAIIEHMKRSGYNEEQILDELKEKNYQIETILKAEKLMDAEKNTCSFCRAVDAEYCKGFESGEAVNNKVY